MRKFHLKWQFRSFINTNFKKIKTCRGAWPKAHAIETKMDILAKFTTVLWSCQLSFTCSLIEYDICDNHFSHIVQLVLLCVLEFFIKTFNKRGTFITQLRSSNELLDPYRSAARERQPQLTMNNVRPGRKYVISSLSKNLYQKISVEFLLPEKLQMGHVALTHFFYRRKTMRINTITL